MLKVNRKVEYGLMALKHMMRKPPEALTPVSEICQHFATPFDPMAHVMRLLNARGLLVSEQGAKGGYRLNPEVEHLSLAEFLEIISGKLAFMDCVIEQPKEKACCFSSQCNIVGPMHALNARLEAFFRSINLKEVLLDDCAVSDQEKPLPTLSFSALNRAASL